MAQQIVITKDNYGIELECYFINAKKKPIDVTGCSIELAILNPSGVQIDLVQAIIKNPTIGYCSYILNTKHTSEEGLYTTIWTVVDTDGYITAQENMYYFIKEKAQSSDSSSSISDADGLEEKIKEIEDELSNTRLTVLNELDTTRNLVNNEIDNTKALVEEVKKVNVSAEIVDARGGLPSLGEKVRELSGHLDTIETEIVKINADKQISPIQMYGVSQVYVDYPKTDGYSVANDIAFADDRNGKTGKIWAFYSDSVLGRVRREVPYIGCSSSELGTPYKIENMFGGLTNSFIYDGNFWIAGAGGNVFTFFDGIDKEPTHISTVSTVGENGDQSFVYNLCVDYDKNNGIWYAWYATFNGSVVGIRRATANSSAGPWNIEPGMWLKPIDIDKSLSWLRVYKILKDKWGRMWAVAGAGRKWGGADWVDKDDGASVWVSPISSFDEKPTKWECVCDFPYFDKEPYGSPSINNAYAPSFLQNGDDWYLYVNTGLYGHERIVELRPNISQSWANISNSTADFIVPVDPWSVESTRAFIRDGVYKISIEGQMVNNYNTPQWHSVYFKLIDLDTNEILTTSLLQNGSESWESRRFNISSIVNSIKKSRRIVLTAQYSIGDGQVTPNSQTSRLRGVSLSIERLY